MRQGLGKDSRLLTLHVGKQQMAFEATGGERECLAWSSALNEVVKRSRRNITFAGTFGIFLSALAASTATTPLPTIVPICMFDAAPPLWISEEVEADRKKKRAAEHRKVAMQRHWESRETRIKKNQTKRGNELNWAGGTPLPPRSHTSPNSHLRRCPRLPPPTHPIPTSSSQTPWRRSMDFVGSRVKRS